MADNTDEENLDTPTNTQSENSSDEIISTTDTETINLNQETENMEVHKHPHHVTHKKKWGEYLLEFLMLFLAVFLGFLAENIREHEVEKERGIGYIKSFYKDLKHDTASLTIMLNDYEKKVTKLNLISPCYDSLSSKLSCNSCLTDLYLNSQYFIDIDISDRTIEQLKNAGGLRLLSPTDADSVSTYDNLVKFYKIQEKSAFQEIQNQLRIVLDDLYIYPVTRNATTSEKPLKGEILTTDDKIKITHYFNLLSRYNFNCNSNLQIGKEMKLRATDLLSYFKNKYGAEIGEK